MDSKFTLERHVRPAKKFQQMLEAELCQEMPDLSQKEEAISCSQEPWEDSKDFVNHALMKPPKRFKSMLEKNLEYNSKAKNTHKHMK